MALTDKLTAIADGFRSSRGTTKKYSLDEMAILAAEPVDDGSGGSSTSVVEKDVNFYDYDGTLLHSYTVAEAQALSELPKLPVQEGLVCQRWNWTLEDIKAHNRAVDVGATYITDDGTTRIYIRLPEGRTSPILRIAVNGTVTIDWGDGTEPNLLTGTSTTTVKSTLKHEYGSPGDYIIRLTVDGEFAFPSSSKYGLLATNVNFNSRNDIYLKSIRKIELGNGITKIGSCAFEKCLCLQSITIPNSVTSIENYSFENCYALSSIIIPNGVSTVNSYVFGGCVSIQSIIIPNGVTQIYANAFQSCYSLSKIIIPDSMTSISSSPFSSCYCLTNIVIPNGVTSIGDSAFLNCARLTNIYIPDSVTSMGQRVFDSCWGLISVSVSGNISEINVSTFSSCRNAVVYDFTRHTSVPSLSNTNAFNAIPSDCQIRVPASLYDEWIAATNWTTYKSNIVAV